MDNIGVKRDGLQLHSIDHRHSTYQQVDLQKPTHFCYLLSPLPPNPGVPHLDQCSPSSLVCRFPLSRTICPPTAAKGGQSPHQAGPLFEQLSRSPQPRPAESGLCECSLERSCLANQVWQAPEQVLGSRQLGRAFTWRDHCSCVSAKTGPGVAGLKAPTGSGVESDPQGPTCGVPMPMPPAVSALSPDETDKETDTERSEGLPWVTQPGPDWDPAGI